MGKLQLWQGAVVVVAAFAALWETKDHKVPSSKAEWSELLVYAVTPSEQVIEYGIRFRETFHDMVQTSRPFFLALCKLLYLTLRPVLLGLYAFLSKAWNGFYEFVVIRLICSPTTIRNVKFFVKRVIQWQMNRTKQEIAMEVAILSSMAAIYFLIRFLNRQRYLERSKLWISRKRRLVQLVRENRLGLFLP